MDSRTAWSVESREALEAVAASAAVLAAGTGSGADRPDPPGVVSLHDADPLRDLADDCLDALAEVARLEARTAALKVRLAAEYVQATRALASPAASPRECTVQEMALVAEVACVLTVSERTAGALLSECQALTTALPLTLTALQAGAISWQHARIIVEETSGLDPDGAAALEAHFLDPDASNPARGAPAGDLVPARFRAKARAWRERHHPVSIEKRHSTSAGDRRVDFLPDRDGMAWLSAYLPADTPAGIWERTTAAARALQGPHEARPLSQLRADITATWLLTSHGTGTGTGTGAGGMAGGGIAGGGIAGGGGVPSPRAQVLITVPVLSLLGVTEEPATLDGYGPIPPSMARRLITDGADSFYRVLTDPRDGAPLEIGRTSYRLNKTQRQWLRLRDGRCPFPGCNNHSLDNEADHLLAWADGGTTGISNLGQPCPRHHRLKHGSAWKPTGASKDNPPGWTSPSRRHYPSEHQDWEPPHWPHHILTTDPNTDTDPGPDPGPDHGLPADPGHQPDPAPIGHPGQDPGQDPGRDPEPELSRNPEPELPTDPFPDWHQFTARHSFTAWHSLPAGGSPAKARAGQATASSRSLSPIPPGLAARPMFG
ncbi:hypothetical protein QFZ79_003280 [Arthrobacter sp. V4I6]|uniref:DUF222 domain-containing protein n=1 Tax=unclassified Arthrobacter TaxID=235627 RepID=UPI002784DA05|nr:MULTISPECIES: DUF222 domain-containing protein [unclassified Arthrobacter]MDQ0820907.1 hypothetical protein [Arthrobacter sp. V1I7]MDQ0855169.1 hypothetical protein [Arthrobacter sp. V4I6]